MINVGKPISNQPIPFPMDRNGHDFLFPLVTVDETWVHYYEPENKAQSRQW